MHKFIKKAIMVMALFAVTVFASACSARTDRVWLDADGWRRAVVVGTTELSDNVPFTLDEQGNTYFLLVDLVEEQHRFRLVGVDRSARVFVDQPLDVELSGRPRDPGFFYGAHGLEAFWVIDRDLYQMSIDADYGVQVRSISNGRRVDNYAASVDPQGQLSVWYSGGRTSTGVYALHSEASSSQAVLVDADGRAPRLQYDKDGDLHAIWVRSSPDNTRKSIYYAEYPRGEYQEGIQENVYTISSSITSRVEGPKLSLDAENVYVLWVVVEQSGHEAGTSKARYIQFPKGDHPAGLQELELAVPNSHELDYSEPRQEAMAAGERVYIDEYGTRVTSNVTEVFASSGEADEVAVALRIRLPHLRNQTKIQVGVAYLAQEAVSSFQLITFSTGNSISPSLIADDDNQLYLTWVEAGEDNFRVFFSSTAADIKSGLRGITASELLDISAEVTFGVVSGMLLIYYPMMWMLAPGLVMILTSKLRRPDETFQSLGTLVSFLLSVGAYWFFKTFFLPDVLTYTPFSAWLPMIPDSWFLPLRVIFPAAITLLAGYVSWRATYGYNRNSPFFMLLIYMAIDGLLTMAVYGVVIYGGI